MVMKIIGMVLYAGSIIYTLVDIIGVAGTLITSVLVAFWLLFSWLIYVAIGGSEAKKDAEIATLKAEIENLKSKKQESGCKR
ncbi:hypothetical protein E2M54_20075 [Salmonella enterica subsp. enterica serovar Nima]|uniref:Uncharacterized protein n=4 Tax=Salmonella enterica TaxID=28901 RepID=A0A633FTR8_SALER|nr:hypothetical protein [Salmonella enterica]EBP3975310.1 hypothetical protein [Salmonella enterica subsp. enterica]ECD3736087.1 hypothetical protein [Salmonella enterica subsp. enterica serovar Stanley]ECD5720418.1 hypothetical protein [Salmonella enterica subsp. enterica serovar Senftenberg]ECF3331292.1 hypothetical protein [Salmonella enterica subsp. enterica serovar Nima]ECF6268809.1 hypothetical protein [Salmonella enterica subsp. arizonae]ECG4922558.1 hypothetical protein [Salmonella en